MAPPPPHPTDDTGPPPDWWDESVQTVPAGLPAAPAIQPIVEHPCELCPAWGCFGFQDMRGRNRPTAWYCADHQAEGERRWLNPGSREQPQQQQRRLFT